MAKSMYAWVFIANFFKFWKFLLKILQTMKEKENDTSLIQNKSYQTNIISLLF